MKYLRYLALLGVLALPLAYSQAEVRFGVGIGFGPGYVSGPPVCAYGYYSYYPYACAPYGFYGPSWFVNGVFIGTGPWYHGYIRPYYGHSYCGRRYYGRSYYSRSYYGRSYYDRRYDNRQWDDRRSYDGWDRNRDFHGGYRGERR